MSNPTATPTDIDLDGDIIHEGHPEYDQARVLYNAMHDRRPAAIVRCASERDVATGLAHAKEAGLGVCIRSGGHSGPGLSVIDDALVIDVRGLKSIAIDAEAKTGTFGPGVTWSELDAATQEHGLALVGGRISSTGLSGLALGSGSGWLERRMGLTPDNLIAARLVTAAGEVVTASENENPDLFWALRGGGGHFGVVVEFTFRLIELGPIVRGGMRIYPLDRAAEIMPKYAEILGGAPDELCGGMALLSAPPAPFVPPEAVGKPVISIIVLWAGDLEGADEGIAPLAELGEPVVDLVQDMPYTEVQKMLDEGNPYGALREYMSSGFLDQLEGDAIGTFIDAAASFTSPHTVLVLQPLGGAYGRVGETDTPLGNRDAGWAYQLLTQWTDPADDAGNVEWTKTLQGKLQDIGRPASFPNFVPDTESGALAQAYAPGVLDKLQGAKGKWDPENVFCHHHRLLG